MDRRSWLWRRKSSEKSPGETESTGSLSSHSERFSDDQRSHSPELISKPVTREQEEVEGEEEATADIKILTERLSAALLNVSLKDDLAKQHAKVAEEAVAGWEKAENEAAALKQQLDASVSKVSALEDRNTHLDSALKECVRQLWQGREEQNQKIEEAVNKKCSEWEATKSELESQIEELQARLQTVKQEDATASASASANANLEALEKENLALKLQLLSKAEEVKLRTLERDLSTQAAESASKQQLEGIKKLTKLEAECRKLRVVVQRSVKSNETKSSVDNQSDYSGRFSFSDNEMQSPTQRSVGKSSIAPPVDIGLMDDFLEMEKLASQPHSEPARKHSESSRGVGRPDAQASQLKHELETSLRRISELEEKVEMVEVEKLQLEMALNESREQTEALQNQLVETEEKLKKLEPRTQDLELSLDESRKQIQDLQRQLNKRQVDMSELETTRAENNDLEELLSESASQIQDLQKQLNKAQVNLSELETIRAEKLELTICLNGTKKQLETSQSRLKETERKLAELQTLLRLTKDAKEAAEDGLKAANGKAEAVESRLRDVEAESQSLILTIKALEESTEKERLLSAKHISKCEELQDEISKLKQELEHHGEAEYEPYNMRAFDEDYKLKQEKELAVAASKFAECQRTIASLGQRLQSLSTLDDFLIES
ncbi:Filament-like plant protein 3 [Hirschfeldia incana]|nr:Filament-like plant protein 3 [Hirschfeldia incana]KAJ0234274.1 Filament-like plant protein 3 [Hirschfeldia incana]